MRISAFTLALAVGVAPANALSSYLNQFTSGPSTVKASTFKPSGSAGTVSSGTGGYLDNIAADSAPPSTPAASEAPVAFSLSSDAPAAPTSGDYLASLPTQTAPSGSGLVGYLDVLRTESAPAGSGQAGYLDTIGGSETKTSEAAPIASSGSTMIAQGPVIYAIKRLSENIDRNQQRTMAVLQEISGDMASLADNAEAAKAARAADQSTELTDALAGTQKAARVWQ